MGAVDAPGGVDNEAGYPSPGPGRDELREQLANGPP